MPERDQIVFAIRAELHKCSEESDAKIVQAILEDNVYSPVYVPPKRQSLKVAQRALRGLNARFHNDDEFASEMLDRMCAWDGSGPSPFRDELRKLMIIEHSAQERRNTLWYFLTLLLIIFAIHSYGHENGWWGPWIEVLSGA